jgi:hypothetical protein
MNRGIVKDDVKTEVVSFINYMQDKVAKRSLSFRELKSMKARYIYKDICSSELKKDIMYLKQLKDLINVES